jgi:hypothetical protein
MNKRASFKVFHKQAPLNGVTATQPNILKILNSLHLLRSQSLVVASRCPFNKTTFPDIVVSQRATLAKSEKVKPRRVVVKDVRSTIFIRASRHRLSTSCIVIDILLQTLLARDLHFTGFDSKVCTENTSTDSSAIAAMAEMAVALAGE